MNNQIENALSSFGIVRPISIDEEMRGSYLDYAMSVIVSRALPDARDGLKPVQRQDSLCHARYGGARRHALQEIRTYRR